MRLPKDENGNILIDEVKALVDAYLAKGFNYFDTAYVYAGSEDAVRKALVERHPRESYTLATKMAGWKLSADLGPEKMFEEQLRRCGVEYFDFYLLHSLQQSRVGAHDAYRTWEYCRKMKEQGKIRHFGFSFHGTPDLLEKLLNEHPEAEFVQLQLNYCDWEDNVIFAKQNHEICRRFGKDIVVMEPVKGGILADLKPEAAKLVGAFDPQLTPASLALRFAAGLSGVKMVLSGMNALSQVEENTAVFEDLKPLSAAEEELARKVSGVLHEAPLIPCTDCRYCMEGCPAGIFIPDVFKSMNMLRTFGEHDRPHLFYDSILINGSSPAKDCLQCGSCEAACPQHIGIVELLQEASGKLDVKWR
jgi:predicted aldo/keto reductase-like oxidoreductase